MAINYKFTNPVQAVNIPKKSVGGLPTKPSKIHSISQTSSRPSFKERLKVKKMMAIRDSAAYQGGQVTDFVKKRLDAQIADIASGSYDADHKRLSTALEHSRTTAQNNLPPAVTPTNANSQETPHSNLSSSLQEKINRKN